VTDRTTGYLIEDRPGFSETGMFMVNIPGIGGLRWRHLRPTGVTSFTIAPHHFVKQISEKFSGRERLIGPENNFCEKFFQKIFRSRRIFQGV
jgi:hypothetical protein